MLTVKSSELKKMNAAERSKALEDLGKEALAPRNGQAKVIADQLREFELRYELSTKDLGQALQQGKIHDTAEVARWMILADMANAQSK